MQKDYFPDTVCWPRYSERRKEQRYEVALHGELRHSGGVFAVQIAELSASGALLFLEGPPASDAEAELWIRDFGVVPVKIVHAGQHFCGVAIINAASYREQLLGWLSQEIVAPGPARAVG